MRVREIIAYAALAALPFVGGCYKAQNKYDPQKLAEINHMLDQAEKQSAEIDDYCRKTADPMLEQARAEREAEQRLRECGMKPFSEKSVEEIIKEGLE